MCEVAPLVYLPQDIITDMLLNLPVKSLLRFKTICKSWKAVITDPQFDSMRQTKVTSWCTKFSVGCTLEIVSKTSNLPSVSRHVYQLDWKSLLPDGLNTIFKTPTYAHGPHNGVYLVNDNYGNLALWNHATRDYRILTEGNNESNQRPSYGFVSEERAGGVGIDFLVLRLHYKWNDSNRGVLESYRLSTGSWRKLKPLPEEYKFHYFSRTSECINGVFYWFGSWNGSSFSIFYDTSGKTYGKLDFLEVIGETPGKCKLILRHNKNGIKSLAYLVFHTENFDAWVMKEVNDVGKSWVKEATIKRNNSKENSLGPCFRYDESLISLR